MYEGHRGYANHISSCGQKSGIVVGGGSFQEYQNVVQRYSSLRENGNYWSLQQTGLKGAIWCDLQKLQWMMLILEQYSSDRYVLVFYMRI